MCEGRKKEKLRVIHKFFVSSKWVDTEVTCEILEVKEIGGGGKNQERRFGYAVLKMPIRYQMKKAM